MLGLTPAEWITIGGTIVTLIFLEGLLSADNALVLAVMVRHLPRKQQKRALRYGILGAFVFRLIAILLAAQILNYWQFEVIGGLYLLYLAGSHLLSREGHDLPQPGMGQGFEKSGSRLSRWRLSFWGTVASVELADIAFSIDSILAAVALANQLPQHMHEVQVGFFTIKTWVIYIGGVLGIITMRYVAGYFLILLERFKGLAVGAYYLVGWIGLKLVGTGLHHALYEADRPEGDWRESVPEWIGHYLEMPPWLFWGGMLLILALSMLIKPRERPPEPDPSTSEPVASENPDR